MRNLSKLKQLVLNGEEIKFLSEVKLVFGDKEQTKKLTEINRKLNVSTEDIECEIENIEEEIHEHERSIRSLEYAISMKEDILALLD